MSETTSSSARADTEPRSSSDFEEPGETLSFSTAMRPGSFLGLSLKNGLLNIVTLTLWRFWGKTEVRRRVWSEVRMNGDAFEYTGRGVELFVGFLIALAVLGLPFLLVVFGAQFLEPVLMFSIILPLYVFVFWLFGFGIFTAFRYMASRTTWRGIRFRLGGSAAAYGGMYLLYLALTAITFGWFQPEAHRNLSERTWNNLYLGTRRLRFRISRAHGKDVYGAFAIGWVGQIVGYFALIAVFFAAMLAFGGLSQIMADTAAPSQVAYTAPPLPTPSDDQPDPDDQLIQVAAEDMPMPPPPLPSVMFFVAFYAALLVILPVWLLLWAPYHAAILRSITAGIMLDKAGFQLDVKALPLWWLTVTNLFFLLITLGFLMPWVQARTVKFMVDRLSSTGKAQLDEVEQTGSGPRTGEGLADAFGFSVI